MSWLFSRVLVEEYSAAKSLDGEPYALLNVMPTPHKFWFRDKTIDHLSLSRYGLTCAVLTDDRGEELLMWFREGFRAKTSPPQVKGQESKGSDLDSGQSLRESYAKYDPSTSSWRTHQCSLFEGLPECLATFARWGSMRNGELYRRRTWEPITLDRGFGSVPNGVTFHHTPTTRPDGGSCSRKALDERGGTPIVSPLGREWLMGWPLGWTGLEPLETVKFPCVLPQLGKSSEAQIVANEFSKGDWCP